MQDSIPAISVCIPTYRGAAHLPATIESVLAQTLGDFELVIVDDNSPDDTARVVADYPDPRIRYSRNTSNLGPEGNWNHCLELARGKYFKLLPQDDLLAPACLARQVQVLEQDTAGQIALVFNARDVIDVNGKHILRRRAFGSRSVRVGASQLIARCVRHGRNLIGEPGSVLLRRELAARVGKFDGTFGYVIDLDYWFRCLQHGDAYYLADALSSFRLSQGAWSVAIGARQFQQFRDFARRYAMDPAYRIGRLDLTAGTFMAFGNAQLRRFAYRWLLPQKDVRGPGAPDVSAVQERGKARP